MKEKALNRIFLITGLLLAVSEIWKQWCLTVVVNKGVYDWWYFPFQLCSLPMYLLPVFPWVKSRKVRMGLLAFLMDYTLLGGVMVWAEPSGLYYPLTALTLHSFLWHILLTVIGLTAGWSWRKRADGTGTGKSFLYATSVYGAGCMAAVFLNGFFQERGEMNMFYINPDAPVTQPVFRQLAPVIGQVPTVILYGLTVVAGAGILHSLWGIGRCKKSS